MFPFKKNSSSQDDQDSNLCEQGTLFFQSHNQEQSSNIFSLFQRKIPSKRTIMEPEQFDARSAYEELVSKRKIVQKQDNDLFQEFQYELSCQHPLLSQIVIPKYQQTQESLYNVNKKINEVQYPPILIKKQQLKTSISNQNQAGIKNPIKNVAQKDLKQSLIEKKERLFGKRINSVQKFITKTTKEQKMKQQFITQEPINKPMIIQQRKIQQKLEQQKIKQDKKKQQIKKKFVFKQKQSFRQEKKISQEQVGSSKQKESNFTKQIKQNNLRRQIKESNFTKQIKESNLAKQIKESNLTKQIKVKPEIEKLNRDKLQKTIQKTNEKIKETSQMDKKSEPSFLKINFIQNLRKSRLSIQVSQKKQVTSQQNIQTIKSKNINHYLKGSMSLTKQNRIQNQIKSNSKGGTFGIMKQIAEKNQIANQIQKNKFQFIPRNSMLRFQTKNLQNQSRKIFSDAEQPKFSNNQIKKVQNNNEIKKRIHRSTQININNDSFNTKNQTCHHNHHFYQSFINETQLLDKKIRSKQRKIQQNKQQMKEIFHYSNLSNKLLRQYYNQY